MSEYREYLSHTIPSKISAVSRMAVKIKDNFYTFEASQERTVEDVEGIDIEKEYQLLFDDLNDCIDAQVQELVSYLKNK